MRLRRQHLRLPRANRLAHYLQARGVGPDRLVALCAERGIEMVVGLLAILKAGGAYVPLDPSHPPERLRRMLDDMSSTIPRRRSDAYAGSSGTYAPPAFRIASSPTTISIPRSAQSATSRSGPTPRACR
nr:AMP-binding protein [Burkholderia pseudomallei]